MIASLKSYFIHARFIPHASWHLLEYFVLSYTFISITSLNRILTVAKVFISDRIFTKLNFFQTDGDVSTLLQANSVLLYNFHFSKICFEEWNKLLFNSFAFLIFNHLETFTFSAYKFYLPLHKLRTALQATIQVDFTCDLAAHCRWDLNPIPTPVSTLHYKICTSTAAWLELD